MVKFLIMHVVILLIPVKILGLDEPTFELIENCHKLVYEKSVAPCSKLQDSSSEDFRTCYRNFAMVSL